MASAEAAASRAAADAALRTRTVDRVVVAHKQREGGGFIVRRPLGGEVSHLGGTFLMLDHLGPTTYKPGEAVGAPDHPHRGFETVTYILQGAMQHRDSKGNKGDLKSGWCQWMTAGSGVVHSEMPEDEFFRTGGTLEGFQLWVNLPAESKMVKPRYQDVPPERLPVVPVPGARSSESSVKVIAGSYGGVSAVIDTHTPITMLDIRLQPGDGTDALVKAGEVSFVYCYRGRGSVSGKALPEGSMAILSDGDVVNVSAAADSEFRGLLLAGKPIPGPIARYGPFVMNTKEELMQAFEDYQAGRLGEIPGSEERYAATQAAKDSQRASGTWSKDSREL